MIYPISAPVTATTLGNLSYFKILVLRRVSVCTKWEKYRRNRAWNQFEEQQILSYKMTEMKRPKTLEINSIRGFIR